MKLIWDSALDKPTCIKQEQREIHLREFGAQAMGISGGGRYLPSYIWHRQKMGPNLQATAGGFSHPFASAYL